MAVTLISTAKATNANANVDEVTADTYLTSNRFYEDAWADASTDDQKSSLIWATFIFDRAMDWYGFKRTTTQALRWPRSGVTDLDGEWYDYDTIPSVLEKATAEMGLYLLRKDRIADPALLGQGFKEVQLGPIKVVVDDRLGVLQLIPDYVMMLLRDLGEPAPEAQGGSDRVVKLTRA
jgi:hypothetical protein